MSRILKNSRLLHLYLGIFTAPAIIFFSITGALQTFSLHETTRGSDYKPPKIIAELSQLHKKQTLVVPAKKPQPPTQAPLAADKPATDKHSADIPPTKTKNLLPMKIFFLFVAVSLLTSTVTGLYMSYRYIRNKLLVTACLVAGIIVPIALAML